MIINKPTKKELRFVQIQINIDLNRRYDVDELRLRFWEQQNCRCFLCGDYFQGHDAVFSQIEHVIPKKLLAEYYVSGLMSLEQVLENANSLKNLRLSHISCGARKSDYDLDEIRQDFFTAPKDLTQEEIQQRREKFSERGKKSGKISGRKAVESGQLDRIRKLPQTKAAQRENGKIAGRKSVENGRLASYRTPEHQRKAGKRTHELHPWHFSNIGKISGKRAVESGRLASICSKGGKVAGKINGKRAVETGQLASICSKGGAASGHVRWHTRRNIVNPNCSLCQSAVQSQ